MREWLTIIIALLIVAVILDGIRRMRHARRYKLRMSPRMPRESGGAVERGSYGSELPNGGARVVNVRKPDDAEELYRQMQQTREEKKRRLGRPTRIPQQVALNLDEQVPMLMEVEGREQEEHPPQNHRLHTSRPQESRPQEPKPRQVRSQNHQYQENRHREQQSARNGTLDDDVTAFLDDERIEPRLSDLEDSENFEFQTRDDRPGPAPTQPQPDVTSDRHDDVQFDANTGEWEGSPDNRDLESENEQELEFREPEDVLVINVMAPKGEHFAGGALLDTVLERGMRYGDMNIFHHHEQANGQGGVLYSMANIVVPGTFDLSTMREFSTPGVSLFLALPVDADSSKAFETMLATAKAIAYNLGGEMKDEQRSVMTAQTVEHYRTRIKEFERKQLSRTPA